MFLFHSVYNDFAVKQKQNDFVSLSVCDLAVKQKQNVFVSLSFCDLAVKQKQNVTALILALLAFHTIAHIKINDIR